MTSGAAGGSRRVELQRARRGGGDFWSARRR
jgi:hypothetical protein